ncbi:MAG: 2-hydroxyacyl-CoA dehydratase family protein [Desulfobacterales bacterium]
MTYTQPKGLNKAEEIYDDRGLRVKALKNEGKKIMGYYCSYPPLEMITAMDFVPFRVQGSMHEPITKADANIPTIVCPIIRSSLDLAQKGLYDFLDGFTAAHTCDCEEKFCRIWEHEIDLPFHHHIDMPHVIRPNSFSQFKDKLITFKQALEKFTGRKLDEDRLRQEIEVHNRQRALVRSLYDLRKEDPPLISGSETLKIMIALMCLPIEEGSQMLEDIIAEAKTREDGPEAKDARLMLWGSPLTEVNLIEMIESLDANIVMDDMCVGSRHYWADVPVTDDPLDGLVKRYLEDITCPRTFRESADTFEEELEQRFGYLKTFARDWKVDGVLLQSVKYCDTHGYEVPGLKTYFEKMNLPAMYLEHEYSMVAEAQLKNRVQAFLELLT